MCVFRGMYNPNPIIIPADANIDNIIPSPQTAYIESPVDDAITRMTIPKPQYLLLVLAGLEGKYPS